MPEIIQPWFDAIAKICLKYHYPLEHHYNMDESKFAVGTNQSSITLINIHKKRN